MHRCTDLFPIQLSIFPTAALSSVILYTREVEPMAEEIKKRPLSPVAEAVAGAFLAGIGAAAASMIAIGHKWEVSVPLAFVLILLVISVVFGSRAGVLGTVIAALIFAAFLFRPLGKLPVASDAARANLAWMLLLGISFSFLFAPQHSGFRRR
jgi:K+-sensing histidine kinase KdpD